ncbi:hypothetical protein HDU67_000004 [Dinochytrium kinnereticum]|nr:hypothetical protein HDU67_000004 [Dinochytrium kinnereticum]
MQRLHKSLKDVSHRKDNLEDELRDRNNKIAMLKQKEFADIKQARSAEELEELLMRETQRRIALEHELKQKEVCLEKTQAEIDRLHLALTSRTETRTHQEKTILDQKNKIDELDLLLRNYEFDVDELKVTVVRHQQRNEELESSMK